MTLFERIEALVGRRYVPSIWPNEKLTQNRKVDSKN
jgi:hypothetical protein